MGEGQPPPWRRRLEAGSRKPEPKENEEKMKRMRRREEEDEGDDDEIPAGRASLSRAVLKSRVLCLIQQA
jgi:hypothetical protein